MGIRFFILLTLLPFALMGGTNPYWQQRVNYTMQVKLNTQLNELSATYKLVYYNHSPDTLSSIWFHLWPNAYLDNHTTYAQHKLSGGDEELQNKDSIVYGGIDSFSWKGNGIPLTISPHPKKSWSREVVEIQLSSPLLPGDSVTITTPFRVKLPETRSRLGYYGSSWQITQWYPKPAVYNQQGWNLMPYLDQGEFFGEFGNFTVEITVPDSVGVAASGICLTPGEQAYLERLTTRVDSIPFPSSPNSTRTFTYFLDQAHDFAWFADAHFKASYQDTFIQGKPLRAWAFYQPYRDSFGITEPLRAIRAVAFYSKLVGPYVYPEVKVVEGVMPAGGGMEYPTITLINEMMDTLSLEEVILHEVGHNWFYGMLGSNERKYPWMDEGINSYYENRYMEQFSPPDTAIKKGGINLMGFNLNIDINNNKSLFDLGARQFYRYGRFSSPGLTSTQYTNFGYGLFVYGLGSRSMDVLSAYVGQARFDQGMQKYYQDWVLRHPLPNDIQNSLEKSWGVSLDTFMDTYMESSHLLDVGIQRYRSSSQILKVKNRSFITLPVVIRSYKGLEFRDTVLVLSPGVSRWSLPKAERYVLDPEKNFLDRNSNNQVWITGKLWGGWKPRIQWVFPKDELPKRFPILVAPAIGGNYHDGLLAGAYFSNLSIPLSGFRFTLLPMYAFNAHQLRGSGQIMWTMPIPDVGKWGVSFTADQYSGYTRYRPQIEMSWLPFRGGRGVEHTLAVAWNEVQWRDVSPEIKLTSYGIGSIDYEAFHKTREHKGVIHSRIEYKPGGFVSLQQELLGRKRYFQQEYIQLRLFAGVMPWRPSVDSVFQFQFSGSTDYLMRQVMFDRLGQSNDFKMGMRQTDGTMGGFGGYTSALYSQGLISANLKVDLPGIKYFALFGDIGQGFGQRLQSVVWDAGICIRVIPDYWEVYFPFLGSMYPDHIAPYNKYQIPVRFMFRLENFTPDQLIKKLK